MYTTQEEMKSQTLVEKQKNIMVSLASFAENYRKETSQELIQIWFESLSHLSVKQIAKGTKKCLRELEFFPTVAQFLEKAMEHEKESDRWQEIDPSQLQLEHKRQPVPMPEEYRDLFRDFVKSKTL